MLAHIVLLDEQRIHREVGIHAESYEGHLGTLLHDLSVVDGVVGTGAPRERSVILHQYGGCMVGIDLADVQDLVNPC